MSLPLEVAAPAKVNLFLRILAREEGGFHRIETLFLALDLADHLTVERAPAGVALEVEGDAPGDPRVNLAGRAAHAFLRASGIRAGVRIRLVKRVPSGAGLGGGSSDAGAALRALNRLFGEPLPQETLVDLAAALGSDVAFFVSGAVLALGWGRGERLLPLPPLPVAPALVLVPPFPIATADAYAAVARARGAVEGGPRGGRVLDPGQLGTWDGVSGLAANDFEPVLLPLYPELERALRQLRDTGPRLALLSGSGSALFAVYADDRARDAARASLEDSDCGRVLTARTLHRIPAAAPGLPSRDRPVG